MGDNDIYFYNNGQVSNGILSSNHTIDHIDYRERYSIFFYPNAQVGRGTLNNDLATNIRTNHIRFIAGDIIYFYQTGEIEGISKIDQNPAIDGINYHFFYPLSFYPSGQIKQGLLDGNQTIHGTNYSHFFWIRFNFNGTVHSSVMAEDQTFRDFLPTFDPRRP